MDVNVIKTNGQVVAFSLFPIGVVGYGKDEKQAITDLNDNLYDFCNWLLWKLPKEPEGVVNGRYAGEIAKVSFKEDDKKLFKKYAEVVLQTAFSFKCMTDSVELDCEEKQLIENVFLKLGKDSKVGVIEFASSVADGEDFKKAREFIYRVYRLAKELFFSIKSQGRQITDSFKFAI